MENYVGKRLDGRYEIREIIGVGGMAVVYKAYDNIENRVVAVKILKEEYLSDEDFTRRFKNESKAIAVLSHPNIVKVLDVSLGDRLQYIVMEYVEGITLKEYIEQQKVIRTREALYFIMQILRALQHAHDKGIVHRDIKPQNIMLIKDGTIKVTDFGIATFARGETRTMTNSAIGSVHYISPEQAKGGFTDAKSDIYSVGVVLYEMITGSVPFQADNAVSIAVMQLQKQPEMPREINPEIPVGLEQIVMRAMQKNPAERYQSAAEMLVDLGEFGKNPSIKFDYNYFVDSQPTRYIPTKEINNRLQYENDEHIETAEERKERLLEEAKIEQRKKIGILAGILGGVLALVLILVLIFAGGSSKKIKVPQFVGLNYAEDIASNDDYAQYRDLIETEFVQKSDVDDGVVFEQSPSVGKKISSKSKIVLKIASNNSKITVPDVYGNDLSTAQSTLRSEGFRPEIQYEKSDEIAEGKVIRTSPERNTKAAYGCTVVVYIPGEVEDKENMVVVPSLAGETSLSSAKERLEEKGLTIDYSGTEYRDSEYSKGYVIGNDRAGAEVPKGTAIAVYISSGYLRHTDVSFNLPEVEGEKGQLVITVNGSEQVNEEVSLDGSSYSANIGGSYQNESVVATIDGKKIYSCKVNFRTYSSNDEVITSEKTYAYAVPTTEKTTVPTTKKPVTTAPTETTTQKPTETTEATEPDTSEIEIDDDTTEEITDSEEDTTERPIVDYD